MNGGTRAVGTGCIMACNMHAKGTMHMSVVSVCVHVCVRVCMCMCTFKCVHLCAHVACVCSCVCVCVCVRICAFSNLCCVFRDEPSMPRLTSCVMHPAVLTS